MQASLLAQISQPADFRSFTPAQLEQLVMELRAEIIAVLSQREGHLGASLGVVELTVALHYCFDTPKDVLIWDVGHQAYGHKMLTGRRAAFARLREWDGISGFPRREESVYDAFGTGHSSTSLSALLGMALAAAHKGEEQLHIAVIGDASIASGMAFEALNHLGTTQANVLIVLNDNTMGIDPSVGALKAFFERAAGEHQSAENLFAALNIAYRGPVDGHDLAGLLRVFQEDKKNTGPRLLHLRTTKGKGLAQAEAEQVRFHAPGKFDPLTGKLNPDPPQGKTKYPTVLGKTLEALFAEFPHLMAITPAMPTGSGLTALMERYQHRCFDVGIAEQHAVTLAAGMATQGLLPFCVIYATFLQRAYDQVMHDVALQNLPVVFCIDRAGLVGHDGPTHHGLYDIAFLRSLPNMTLLAPRDEVQLRQMLYTLSASPPKGPVAIRYPRGYGVVTHWEEAFKKIDLTQGHCLKEGEDLAIISVGTTAQSVQEAWQTHAQAERIAHYDLGSIKPLDTVLLKGVFSRYQKVITVEDAAREGGAGSAVLLWAYENGYRPQSRRIGLPDRFIPHGSTATLKEKFGLNVLGIHRAIDALLSEEVCR